jgi:hypothetical protein
MPMNNMSPGKTDKIGELWSELQKTEERLRTVGGGISAPVRDCFMNDTPKDPFDATVFTALGDADLRTRIGQAQPAVAAMVAAVVADIDGMDGTGQLSPFFGRGRAHLATAASVEGPHSQWTAAPDPLAPRAPDIVREVKTPREQLAKTAAEAKAAQMDRGALKSSSDALNAGGLEPPAAETKSAAKVHAKLQSSSDALSAGGFDPAAHKTLGQGKKRGGIESTTDALAVSAFERPEPLQTGLDLSPDMFENPHVPEPRAHRDLPTAVHAELAAKTKALKKKRPLWRRILWG